LLVVIFKFRKKKKTQNLIVTHHLTELKHGTLNVFKLKPPGAE